MTWSRSKPCGCTIWCSYFNVTGRSPVMARGCLGTWKKINFFVAIRFSLFSHPHAGLTKPLATGPVRPVPGPVHEPVRFPLTNCACIFLPTAKRPVSPVYRPVCFEPRKPADGSLVNPAPMPSLVHPQATTAQQQANNEAQQQHMHSPT
jgi:hypothetical protein